MRKLATASIMIAATAASVPPVAQCLPVAKSPCVLDLHGEGAPRAAEACSGNAWRPHLAFELPKRFADADGNGWHEAVVEVKVDPDRGCRCVVFRVVYGGEPLGYHLNIGDSPTNDGHGGDAWSTLFDAELMFKDRDLTAFGSEQPDSPAETQIFGLRDLGVADRELELEICDQSVLFAVHSESGPPESRGFFNTYRSRELIAIAPEPENDELRSRAPDSRVYAAFNRVIHRRSGKPSRERFGAGVRRVEISLTP